MLEIHKNVFSIFNHSSYEIKSDKIVFTYSRSIESKFDDLGIKYEKIRNETLSVEKKSLPMSVYSDFKSYLKISEINVSKSVLILNINSLPYSLIEDKTYINFEQEDENYFFKNAISFNDFIEYLKTHAPDTDETFIFIDYLNDISRKIVLTSLADKGRLIIKYHNHVQNFNENIDLSISLVDFKKCFDEQNYHLPKFLKSSIIEYASRFDADTRIFKIYETLGEIVDKAKINFEVYLNNLSIDKIRKEYDDYKSKYFKDVSEILNNLTHKIIGLPIFISTILFAVEKSKDSVLFLVFLILIILITNLYVVLLLKINVDDLTYIKKIVNQDFDALKENNFFTKYPKELVFFTKIKSHILKRVDYLRVICESYFWVLGLANISIIALILRYIECDSVQIILISLALIYILYISRKILMKNRIEQTENN
ncbi:hypothetical protein [Myroides sp. N17-2]|uniref:hypothetical protein n=1 Tax=Myroides sp. N17-2 TaxID=2030799 RepID=UPI000EFD5ED2|nr:hypothetical protein [Myroides sp. N17-2]